VLGESVLASTTAVAEALNDGAHILELAAVGFSGLTIAAAMWWLYFSTDPSRDLTGPRAAFTFGYGHYAIFAAVGAFSAGISVLLDSEIGALTLSSAVAASTLTVPVAIFVFGIWALILRRGLGRLANLIVPFGAALIAASALIPWSILWTAVLMVGLVFTVELAGRRTPQTE